MAEALSARTQELSNELRAGRRDDYAPRYVDLPPRRDSATGSRNLAFGGGALFLALLIGGTALFVVGPRAILPLAACLFTFTVLYALVRLQVFREQHGAFLALGVVCLLGALFALAERAFHGLDGNYWAQLSVPPPAQKQATPAPAPDRLPTLLSEAFALTPPDAKAGPRVKALKDSRVIIEGKPFLIKAGDVFAFAEAKDEEVTFKVRDLHIALPASAVEVLDEAKKEKVAVAAEPEKLESEPPPATPPVDPAVVEVTKHAQNEAVKRYPALGIEGSRENEIFVTTFRGLKGSGDTEFFKNPEWPLELAELLAKRQGWVRDDVPTNRTIVLPEPSSRPEPQLPILDE